MDQKELSLRQLVRRQILDLISRMDFDYSTRLLSENHLAAKLQVSRSTIRAVLADLEKEGKIIRRHGSGTYVNTSALNIETTLYPQINMYDLVCKNGFTPGLKVLSYDAVPAGAYAQKLELYPSELIREIHSIYLADGEPCMYCIDRVDARRLNMLDWKNYEQHAESIYDFIRHGSGIDIRWDIITIKARHSGQLPELQRCFSVPEGQIKPLTFLEIMNYDNMNQPTLYGNIYVDTEKIHLNIVGDLTKL